MIHSVPKRLNYNSSGEFDVTLKVIAENMDTYGFHVSKLSQEENIGHGHSVCDGHTKTDAYVNAMKGLYQLKKL